MLLILRSKKIAKHASVARLAAIKTLDHALTNCPRACAAFVDALGLKSAFAAFMGKGQKTSGVSSRRNGELRARARDRGARGVRDRVPKGLVRERRAGHGAARAPVRQVRGGRPRQGGFARRALARTPRASPFLRGGAATDLLEAGRRAGGRGRGRDTSSGSGRPVHVGAPRVHTRRGVRHRARGDTGETLLQMELSAGTRTGLLFGTGMGTGTREARLLLRCARRLETHAENIGDADGEEEQMRRRMRVVKLIVALGGGEEEAAGDSGTGGASLNRNAGGHFSRFRNIVKYSPVVSSSSRAWSSRGSAVSRARCALSGEDVRPRACVRDAGGPGVSRAHTSLVRASPLTPRPLRWSPACSSRECPTTLTLSRTQVPRVFTGAVPDRGRDRVGKGLGRARLGGLPAARARERRVGHLVDAAHKRIAPDARRFQGCRERRTFGVPARLVRPLGRLAGALVAILGGLRGVLDVRERVRDGARRLRRCRCGDAAHAARRLVPGD